MHLGMADTALEILLETNRKNAFCLRGDELKLRKTSMHPVGVVKTNYGCKLRKKKTLQTEGKFIVKRNTLIRFVQYEFLTFQRGTVIKPACDWVGEPARVHAAGRARTA